MSAPAPQRPRAGFERYAVSALFADVAGVDRALAELNRLGVPRDVMEVVVSPRAAERFYPGAARRPRGEALRYAGAGALIGLVVGAVISLVLVALPGFLPANETAVVQLLGPNFGTVAGAVVGALLGLGARRRGEPRFRRAAEAPDAIVLVVALRTEEEARELMRVLERVGGQAPRMEE